MRLFLLTDAFLFPHLRLSFTVLIDAPLSPRRCYLPLTDTTLHLHWCGSPCQVSVPGEEDEAPAGKVTNADILGMSGRPMSRRLKLDSSKVTNSDVLAASDLAR